ncbi:MAG: hypothetical protein ACEPOW_08075 [Bacteroidales bacterium]
MAFNNNALSGFLAGLGLTLAGVYYYKKNKNKIHDLLRSQGINIPEEENSNLKNLSLEELVCKKEEIEDLLAELEEKMKSSE